MISLALLLLMTFTTNYKTTKVSWYGFGFHGKVVRPLQTHPERAFDLSKVAFNKIANLDKGIINVKYVIIK